MMFNFRPLLTSSSVPDVLEQEEQEEEVLAGGGGRETDSISLSVHPNNAPLRLGEASVGNAKRAGSLATLLPVSRSDDYKAVCVFAPQEIKRLAPPPHFPPPVLPSPILLREKTT